MDDKLLRKYVVDELEFEPSVDAAHIGIAVDKGVVTLTGRVGSYAQKIAAEKAVQRVKGVTAIAEELKVSYGGEVPADEELARRAVHVLQWDALLSTDAIKVKVEQGWVTLAGMAQWQFQRDAAERCVRKLHGVVGLSNEIQVKAKVRPDDVKRRIEDAFKRNATLDARQIRVEVADSKVTLEGKVHDMTERNAARAAAWAIPGVMSVVDHLLVA